MSSAVGADAEAPHDAGNDAEAEPADVAPTAASYGTERAYAGAICSFLLRGNFRVAERDLRTSFVDGDDLLALVNRSPTGALSPDYAPSDMVDFGNHKPQRADRCEVLRCLRKDAMDGYDALTAAMKERGMRPSLQSAYRSYRAQCGTFGHWAGASNACKAAQQSALPGHSQHQLGTVVDLFTETWRASGPGVFRNGFGCDAAGQFLREHAWEYGWVLPYPIHPDDRSSARPCEPRVDLPVSINPATGYGHEAWHLRFVGTDHARAFHAASERDPALTLEQWLREKRGLSQHAATELPVCDGCNCGACASLAPAAGACATKALALDALWEHAPAPSVRILSAKQKAAGERVLLQIELDVGEGALTQPPLFRNGKAGYAGGETFEQVIAVAGGQPRAFLDVAGALRVAAGHEGSWPYRVALPTTATAALYDRANVALPATLGTGTVSLEVPAAITEVAVLAGDRVVARTPVAAPEP